MIFSRIEVNRITRELGYQEFEQGEEYVESILTGIVDHRRRLKILELLDELEELKGLLKGIVLKSHLRKVDTIEFDYSTQIKELKREGSRIIREVGNQAGLAVKFDPFKGNSGGGVIKTNLPG